MKIIITGSPGTGKTALAKELGKQLKIPFLNEKEFSLKKNIGEWDSDENELVVPLKKLEEKLSNELDKSKSLIIEGHMLCEIQLPVDLVIVLRVDPELLEARLEQRRYKPEKLADNVFIEGIDYCIKHCKRNYSKEKIFETKNEKGIKEALRLIVLEIKKRNLL